MRYIIGIDLGTTNSCVAYVDSDTSKKAIQPFRIPQLTAIGCSEFLETLPSFCYLAGQHEWPLKALDLPWKGDMNYMVGRFAHEQGAKVSTRLVQSAKSWLCHAGANRKDKILPFESAVESDRISPVEATARYLKHIKEAWNHTMANGDPTAEFEEQEIILTVPASFDEVARTLTVEAAKLAGFIKMTLLEEPQAAFYAWLSHHEQSWEKKLKVGDYILVCDVGGGTSDFSLMEVISQGEKLTIQRMAVGDHLLLGGDNMDAALTYYFEQKLRARDPSLPELNPTQWLQLRHEARRAKETLLDTSKDASSKDNFSLLLQGTGSGVIKGSLSLEVTHAEVESFLLQGFFGQYTWEEALQLRKGSGIRTMGLPYEEEASITKHLAAFLKQSAPTGQQPIKPHYILFNGGAMKPVSFQTAITESLIAWFPNTPLTVLPSPHLDLSVARGATYYGKVRRGLGVRIGGGAARGYYLAIEVKAADGSSAQKALTLLPRGSEEGSSYEPHQDENSGQFWLLPNTPVAFHLYSSHVRLHDKAGDLIAIDPEEMQRLPPIHTVLRYGKQKGPAEKIAVQLIIKLTAIGTLQLWLEAPKTGHRWELEFQVRSAAGQDNTLAQLDQTRADETFDAAHLHSAQTFLEKSFGESNASVLGKLVESLETLLERPRKEWSLSVLRGLWEPLLKQAAKRKLSAEHEGRWWNVAGFILRPGFGYPLDDFRLKEIWKIILSELNPVKSQEIQIQQWICYRRLAGGLNKGQQIQLASTILPTLINKKSDIIEVKGKNELYPYSEKVRLMGALELIELPIKIKLGEALLARILANKGIPADYWALGRIGARHLLYGTISNVVPRDICAKWTEKMLTLNNEQQTACAFVIGQFARQTNQRELNLPQELIERVLRVYADSPQIDYLRRLLQEEHTLTQLEQEQVFGDKLPIGLTLEQ